MLAPAVLRECKRVSTASVHVPEQSQGVKCYKDQSCKSEEEQTQAEQNETQKDTSPLEKLLVFFYPSQ